MPEIILFRTSQRVNSLREYEIIIDNKQVSTIKDSEEKVIKIPEGIHNIFLKIDWCKSKVLTLNLSNEQKIKLICGSKMTGIKQFFMILYLFYNDQIVYLDYWSNDRK